MFWIRENVLSLPTIKFRFLGARTHCLVTILTELLQKEKKECAKKKQEKKERWEIINTGKQRINERRENVEKKPKQVQSTTVLLKM